jgi:hypothetical protein
MEDIDIAEVPVLMERLVPQYLAGLFDGEGCINVCTPKHTGIPFLQVTVSQAGEDGRLVMSMVASKFRGTTSTWQSKEGRRKPATKCIWNGKNAKPFLECIKDHVVLKRKRVEFALKFIELIGDNNSSYARREIGAKIIQLNDSWKRVGGGGS